MARGEVGKGEDLRDVLPGHEGGCDLSAMPLLDLLFEVNCPLCRWSVLLPVRKGGKLSYSGKKRRLKKRGRSQAVFDAT